MFAFDRQRFLAEFTARTGVAMNAARQQALTFLLDSIERDDGFTTLRELAYVLATIHWETGRTFSPVKELRASETRNPSLYARQQRYWPSGYYGRGYVQLTWDYNYKNASKKLEGEVFPVGGETVTVTPTTFLEHPDYLLEPAISYRIAARGMREGWFTGKRLSQYIPNASAPDYRNARRIINGVDRAVEIAEIAKKYEALLSATQVGAVASATVAAGGGAASVGTGRSAPPPRRPVARAQSVGRSAPPPPLSVEPPASVSVPASEDASAPVATKPAATRGAKQAVKPAVKRAAKPAAKKAAKPAAKKAAKPAAKQAGRKKTTKVVKKTAKKTAKKAAKKAVKKSAKKVVNRGVKRATKKVAKKVAKKAMKKSKKQKSLPSRIFRRKR